MAQRALHLHVVSFLLVVSFVGSVSYSQSPETSTLLPLDSVLNPDGSFRTGTGLTGSLDPTGWHMHLGPHGEPMFSRTPGSVHSFQQKALDTDTGDVHWDDNFPGPVGTNNSVSAIAVHGNDLYFGGAFTGTESIEANYVVRWDGVSWKALGSGVDGPVMALAFVDSILFVGGYFSMAGGMPANRVAAWDGNDWSTLGQSPNDGVSGSVAALMSMGSDLYVAGYFATAGNGMAVGNIARWDGSAWHAVGTGTGPNDFIYTLATDGASIYAGGYITVAGGSPAHYIARWDGIAWHTLGDSPYEGTNDFVSSLAFARGKLYVGGNFSIVGGVVNAAHIAVWDGSHWSSPEFSLSGNVIALCFSDGKLYISGDFSSTASQRGYVAAWDSAQHTLSFLANGLNSLARAIADYGSDIYFAGSFTDYSNVDTTLPSNYIARWTGSKWTSLSPAKLPNSTAGILYAVAVKDSDLYLGGLFDAAGTVAANNIVQWQSRTQSWKSLGDGLSNGVDGAVEAISVSGSGAVYVGGRFLNAGGAPARNIAKWDGAAWSPFGLGLHIGSGGAVYAIAEVNSATEYHLYAGGRFDSAGTVAASNIAEWTGTTWVSLGSGVAGSGINSTGVVYALQPVFDRLFRHAKLYVGGDFVYAGGSPATRIAVWDAGTWSALGSPGFEGVLGPVHAIRGDRSAVYVGGSFHRAGGSVDVNNIAKWDGSSWSSLGEGVDSTVQALLLSGDNLFATGRFRNAGGTQVDMIARWNFADSSWHPLGSGLDNPGFSLASSGDDIYVGGLFERAGGKRSYRLAHWNQSSVMASVPPARQMPESYSLEQNYPNPFNPTTIIRYTITGTRGQGPGTSNIRLVVYDVLGREVAALVNEKQSAGTYEVKFDGSGLASGMYFVRLTAGEFAATRSMILLK